MYHATKELSINDLLQATGNDFKGMYVLILCAAVTLG